MADINIYGVLKNATPENVIAVASLIKDETMNKTQEAINKLFLNGENLKTINNTNLAGEGNIKLVGVGIQDFTENEELLIKSNLNINDKGLALEYKKINSSGSATSSSSGSILLDTVLPANVKFLILDLAYSETSTAPSSPNLSIIMSPNSNFTKWEGGIAIDKSIFKALATSDTILDSNDVSVDVTTTATTCNFTLLGIRYSTSSGAGFFKGHFNTKGELTTAHPTSDKGAYAYVGNPRHLYTYNTSWVDNGILLSEVENLLGTRLDIGISLDLATKLTTEYNVSLMHPKEGPNGDNKYTLETAILKIPQELRTVGIKCSFIAENGFREVWQLRCLPYIAVNWDNITPLNNRMLPLAQGLPMVLKSSKLENEISNGRTLTPYLLSRFLLDFKINGTPKEGCTYRFRFQYKQAAEETVTYANYLFLSEVNNLGESADIGFIELGAKAPVGKKVYHLSIKIQYTSYIKEAFVLLDYDVLNGFLESGYDYSIFNLESYEFDQKYIFDLKSGLIVELQKVESAYNLNDKVVDVTKIAKANESIISEKVVWQLDNDLEFFNSSYSNMNIGQYSDIFKDYTSFNTVVLNKVSSTNNTDTVQYKIYIVNKKAQRVSRGCPIGVINESTHILLKEGDIKLGEYLENFTFILDKVYIVGPEEQVAIYLSSKANVSINMLGISNGLGNPEETSHVSLICNDTNPFDGGAWYGGSMLNNKGWFNVAITLRNTPVFVKKEEFQGQIDEAIDLKLNEVVKPTLNLDITIPDKMFAIVGTEMNIWNDAVSLSIDKGLYSPLNYIVKWTCNKGLITDRCFRFTPTDGDVGQHNCTCTIFDMNLNQLSTKTFKIIVLAKDALKQHKNIVYFGDSLGQDAANALYNSFNNSGKFTGIKPVMYGTRGTSFKFEAVGGYGWSDYATSGRFVYRIFVTGVSAANVGATYKLSGYEYPFTVREVNINDGEGNMLIELQLGQKAENFPESGTIILNSGGGDSSISYTGGKEEPNNPLWNNDTKKLDISLYRTRLGLSEKIDAASFQFGINDNHLANVLTTLKGYITDLYTAFIEDNPNCKIIIGLTTSSGNDFNGAGANYGATFDCISYLLNVYKIRQFYLSLQNLPEYPNLVISPTHLYVDRYYGYDFYKRDISQRYTLQEQYHGNFVHPGNSGYGQIADAFFSTFIGALI